MAGARGSDSGFHGCVWLFTRPDAFEEILHVSDGSIAEAFPREHWILSRLRIFAVNGESAAVDLQGCFGSTKLQAAIID